MLRSIIGFVVGVAAAMATVSGSDAIAGSIYPPPPGFDFRNAEQLAAYVQGMPMAPQLVIAAGWFMAPFVGALIAMGISRRSLPGWIVATFFLAAATANLILIPHPGWMAAFGFILPGVAAMLAEQILRSRLED